MVVVETKSKNNSVGVAGNKKNIFAGNIILFAAFQMFLFLIQEFQFLVSKISNLNFVFLVSKSFNK